MPSRSCTESVVPIASAVHKFRQSNVRRRTWHAIERNARGFRTSKTKVNNFSGRLFSSLRASNRVSADLATCSSRARAAGFSGRMHSSRPSLVSLSLSLFSSLECHKRTRILYNHDSANPECRVTPPREEQTTIMRNLRNELFVFSYIFWLPVKLSNYKILGNVCERKTSYRSRF